MARKRTRPGERPESPEDMTARDRDFAQGEPLARAVEEGRLDLVRSMIATGIDVDDREDPDFDTPLLIAAKAGRIDLVGVLLDAGADADARDAQGRTPLMVAALNGGRELFDALAPRTDPDERARAERQLARALRGGTKAGKLDRSLLKAAGAGDLGALGKALAAGADVHAIDREGRTALHIAALHTLAEDGLVGALLEAGADPDARDEDGGTPLFLAGDATIRLLVAAGADPDARSASGRTPLHFAAARGLLSTLRALIAAGARPDSRDRERRTPLHLAALSMQPDAFVELLRAGADPDGRDGDGHTALDVARRLRIDPESLASLLRIKAALVESGRIDGRIDNLIRSAAAGRPDEVRRLRDAGVDVNGLGDLHDHPGLTALYAAIMGGHVPVVRALLSAGANPEARVVRDGTFPGYRLDGATPLLGAAARGHSELVRLLLEAGAAPDGRLKPDGPTPLMFAARFGHVEVARALLGGGAEAHATTVEEPWFGKGTSAPAIARSVGAAEILRLLEGGGPEGSGRD